MAAKQYRVVRESHEHDRFFINYPEYGGYRMYVVEAPNTSGYGYAARNHQYLVTREGFLPGQTVLIDEGTELLPVRDNSSIHLGGNKVFVYRPERHLDEDFEIVSFATDGDAIEKFGHRDLSRKDYNLYNAKRAGSNGYNDVLVRIFTKSSYAKGMRIPVNETVGLTLRSSLEKPHYMHDTESKAYIDRLWRAVRSSCGALTP